MTHLKTIQPLLVGAGVAACTILSPAADVVISEFMAANDSGLTDEDGEWSDWIELHNPGPVAVDLNGWHLTDNPSQLTQWQLPSTNIAAHGYLLVFASGKDRRTPGAPLHASFKLSSGGEFLALTRPDGTNIASHYTPAFPPQVADVSYGLDYGFRLQVVLSTNAPGRLWIPTNDADGTNWRRPDFDDANWLPVTGGVGYSVGSIADLSLTNALVGYWKFDETNGLMAADSAGSNNHGALRNFPADNSQWVAGRLGGALRFRGSPSSDYVYVTNYAKSTTQLTLSAWVWAESRPTWASIIKNWPGGNASHFHFGLTDATGDLSNYIRQNNADYGLRETVLFPLGSWQHVACVLDANTERLYRGGVQVASAPYSGTMPLPTSNPAVIGAKLLSNGATDSFWHGCLDEVALWNRALSPAEIQSLAHPGLPLSFPPASDLRTRLYQSNTTCYLRFPFVVENPRQLRRWFLRLQYNDGFAAWLNSEEITRRNAPENLAWNSAATNAQPPDAAAAFEDFNLADLEEFIVAGTNVLAIQALNLSLTDKDFLLVPMLDALSTLDLTNAPVYFTTPTPGSENVVGMAELGPIIKETRHAPAVPRDAEDLVVTARVAPTFAALADVTLHWRVMFSNETATPMLDDGAHGDGTADDGTYGAIIAAQASSAGQMVRYFVTASDAAARVSRLPIYPGDPDGAPQYAGTVVWTPALTSSVPVLSWFVRDADKAASYTRTGTRCGVFYEEEFYDNVFVRLRGGFTVGNSQKFDFNRGYRFAVSNTLDRVDEINLNTQGSDPAYVRPALSFEAYRQAGVPAPFSFIVQMRVNNAADRVANLIEQVDEDFLKRFGLDPGASMYKLVQPTVTEPGFTSLNGARKQIGPPDDFSDLQGIVNGLNLPTPAERAAYVLDHFNVPELVSWFATRSLIQDQDTVRKNHYFYRDLHEKDEWSVFPWDKDLTFGILLSPGAYETHPFMGTQAYLLQSTAIPQWSRLHETVLNHPLLKEMVLRRMRTVNDRLLGPPGTPANTSYFEKMADVMFAPAYPLLGAPASNQVNALKTWLATRRVDLYVTHSATNLANPQRAGIPGPQPANATVQIFSVEANPSSGNPAEEYLCLSNPVPFAVDLSGWRLEGAVRFTFAPGTVLGSSNLLYLSPDVRAFRARSTGPRGGLSLFVQGNYQGQLSARGETVQLVGPFGQVVHSLAYPGAPSLAQQYLRVTEIMYNPAPLAGNPTDAQEFEFIELKNVSTNALLDLAGVRFVGGIEFNCSTGAVATLAPGAHMLLLRNLAAFTARYGPGLPLAGQYTGHLDNNGERLRLVDAQGEEILDFEYNNQSYPVTDGLGFSLVQIHEEAAPDDWGNPANWRASGQLQGSPATLDLAPPSIPPILITEVLSRTETPPLTDSIELHNPTAQPVDVGHWYLTDDFDTPRKFRIPPDTTIPPGGYLVFDESRFNPVPDSPPGFALSADGDEVWLFSADPDGALSGYQHGFRFGAAAPSVSFGRYVTSVGEEHFVAQSALTLDAANAGPKVGPVVISEIHDHPVDDPDGQDNARDEFIELVNISADPVGLYDSASPSHTWQLTDAVDFGFPTGLELAPGERLLVVSFDPAQDPAALAEWRARFAVVPGVRVVGPFAGKLDNSTERVQLQEPTLLPGGRVALVQVDAVRYNESAPWPRGADGFGLSLQRRDASAYGDDPINWRAAPPTPGAPTFIGGDAPAITGAPTNQTALAGTRALWSVSALGTGPLRYQWRFNRQNIRGATLATFELPSVKPSDFGPYDVVVYNEAGSAVSAPALLTVLLPPAVLTQPQSVAVRPGANITFSVQAYSADPVTYQWRKNRIPIPGATGPLLQFQGVDVPDRGDYDVVVTDRVGSAVSDTATLTVLISPVIVTHPVGITNYADSTVTFSVEVTNTATLPIGYRWRKGSTVVTNRLLNSYVGFLTLHNVQKADEATYTVVVTNQAFSTPGYQSQQARLGILAPADSDGDGLPDSYEQGHQLNPNDPTDAAADADGDGVSNKNEYQSGTDPQDPESYLRIESITASGHVAIRFQAVASRTYVVQFRDGADEGMWQTLAGAPAISGTDTATRPVEVLDAGPPAPGQRYYRLVTPGNNP